MYCNAIFRPLEGRFVAMKVQCPFVLKNLQLLIIEHILVDKNVSKHQKQHSNVYYLTFNHSFFTRAGYFSPLTAQVNIQTKTEVSTATTVKTNPISPEETRQALVRVSRWF